MAAPHLRLGEPLSHALLQKTAVLQTATVGETALPGERAERRSQQTAFPLPAMAPRSQ